MASVVAISYCHTYSLHAEDLNAILSDHPVMKKALERVAADRLKHIGEAWGESLMQVIKQ